MMRLLAVLWTLFGKYSDFVFSRFNSFLFLDIFLNSALAFADIVDREFEALRKHQEILNRTAQTYENDGDKSLAKFVRYQFIDIDLWNATFRNDSRKVFTDPEKMKENDFHLLTIRLALGIRNENFEMFNDKKRLIQTIKITSIDRYIQSINTTSDHKKQYSPLKDIVLKLIESEHNNTDTDEFYNQIYQIFPEMNDTGSLFFDALVEYIKSLKEENLPESTESAKKLEILLGKQKILMQNLLAIGSVDSKEKVDQVVELFIEGNNNSKGIFLGEDVKFLKFLVHIFEQKFAKHLF